MPVAIISDQLLMVLLSIRKISKDDHPLFNILRQLMIYVEKFFWEELGQDKRGPAAEKKINSTDMTERPACSGHPRSHVGISENIELLKELICIHVSALHVYRNPYKIGRQIFHDRLLGTIQSTNLAKNRQVLVRFTAI